MENWGLITYRTTAILFDEQHSDAKYKNRVAYVVAHGKPIRTLVDVVLRKGRACPSMVRKPSHDGLVERALAERRIRHLGWMASYRPSLSRLPSLVSICHRSCTDGSAAGFSQRVASYRGTGQGCLGDRSDIRYMITRAMSTIAFWFLERFADCEIYSDAISYLKGSSVIRMLSNHLGVGTFLGGVSEYLKAHAYGSFNYWLTSCDKQLADICRKCHYK